MEFSLGTGNLGMLNQERELSAVEEPVVSQNSNDAQVIVFQNVTSDASEGQKT
jgi:hypothetical protein